MDRAAEILVIINSALLLLVLLLALYVLIQAVIVLRRIRRAAKKAETLTKTFGTAGAEALKQAYKPQNFLRLLKFVANASNEERSKKHG